jgi:hypothetical protein
VASTTAKAAADTNDMARSALHRSRRAAIGNHQTSTPPSFHYKSTSLSNHKHQHRFFQHPTTTKSFHPNQTPYPS